MMMTAEGGVLSPGHTRLRPVERAGLLIAFLATCFGTLQAVKLGMPADMGGAQVRLSEAFVRSLGIWWLWALLSPIVFFASRRWHPERVGVFSAIAGHAAAAVIVSMCHSLIYVPVMLVLVWPELLPQLDLVWRVNVVGNIFGDLVTYTALAGTWYAVDYRRSRRRVPSPGTAEKPEPTQWLQRISVRQAGRVTLVPVDEVEWIQANGDYALLHCHDRRYLAAERLAALAITLDPAKFLRVHRSAIVNLDRVRQVRPRTHGDQDIILVSGQTVRSSRTYRDAVLGALLNQRARRGNGE